MIDAVIDFATPADLPELMRLERSGFASAIQETEDVFAGRLQAFPDGCRVLRVAGDAAGGRLGGYLCAEVWRYADRVEPMRFARNHSALAAHDPGGDELYVSSMVVDPALRGGGWGARLFTTVLQDLRERLPQLCSAILIVHPEWLGARRIYTAAGFVEVAELQEYFAGSASAIVMRCALR